MSARIDEISPDLYRITVYVPEFDLQFNPFLLRDDEPLLYHTGMRPMFPAEREAVGRLMDPAGLKADFSGVRAATLTVTGSADEPRTQPQAVPTEEGEHEVLWMMPAELIRQRSTGPVVLTLRTSDAEARLLGEYVLDHSAIE